MMTKITKSWLALIALLTFAGVARAQTHADKNGTIVPGVAPIYLFVSAGAAQMALAIGSTASSLTVPSGATIAQICVETAGVRYRDDGTAPTASSGTPVAAGTCFQYAGPLSSLQFIAQSGSPTIDVLYYKSN